MNMNKRGVSRHVEMMISFLIFVTFVTFLLIFVKPYDRSVLPESVLSGLVSNFEEKSSVNLTSVFVKVLSNADPDLCGNGGVERGKILVNIPAGNVMKKQESGDSFYLFISEGVSSSYVFGDCSDFVVGSVENKEIVSFLKLNEMEIDYQDNYDGLHFRLGVPNTIDFSIESDVVNMEKQIPEGLNVVARTRSFPVLFEDGSIVNKEFVFRIW